MAEIVDVLLRARMEASGVEAGVGQIQKSLQGLTLPKGLSNDLEKSFSKLTPLLKDYQKQLNKGFSNKKDLQNFNALKEKISETFGEIRSQVQSVNSQDIRLRVDTQEIDKLENQIVAKTAKLQEALSKVFTKNVNTESVKEQLDKVIGSTGRAATIKPMANMAKQLFNSQDYAAYNAKIDELKNKILSLSTTKVDLATALGVKDAANNIDAANDKVDKFFNNLKVNEGKVQTIEHLKQELQELGVNLENVKLESLTRGASELQGLDSLMDQLSGSLRDTGNAASDAGQSMVRMVDEVNELKTSTQYFFSLRNMINLLKRGVDDAVQSVKELDKAMTETAVVTDYKVSDLWGMLPEYTKVANELGATTQGAYETMTLYYQQGLDQQQAFEIGAETMKMARIAGLDYAETTDMMTAALRGFNMELNETSAKRVNDVYSELAAITASDTEELGKAMQRTASIAHSAGASFEGTTAFLAQAIETTREPAENIGTAMKTIVARFQEMKKNPLEISEVDGEEVDYNKIDAALKTIGVDLKDTNGQFREFDEVMLDISARWDTLSQSQQRYIATIAAGSRQQSRFIAMVSNYDRTMELMQAANNSAGASDEQFGKTMDSLEAKINKLHNAWQQFTMGIANNSMIKFAVDGITGLLTVTNKLIDTFSLGIGPVKSLLSLLMAFTGLKAAGRVANSMIGGLGGLLDPQSSFFKGFKGGFVKNTDSNAQANAISNPIVQAIHQLQSALTGKAVTTNNQGNTAASYETFKTANSDLRALLKETGTEGALSLSKAYGKISGLDNKQQASILQQLPGLQLNLKRDGIQFDTNGIKKESAKLIETFKDEINQGLKKNTVTPQNAMQIFGTPAGFKQAMEARGPEYAKAAQEAFGNAFKEQFTQEEFYEQAKKSLMSSEDYSFLNEEELHQAATKEAEKAYAAQAAALEDFNKRATIAQTKGAMVANSIGNIGSVATSAGQGIAQLGMQLSNAGFDAAGAAVTNLGYQISSLGQIAASAGNLVGKITDAGGIGGLLSAHPYMAAAGVAIAAVGGIIALAKAQEKHAREAAEKTVKTYTDTINETTEKVSTLNSAKDIFNQLSSGVDEYGNNIGLTTEEYDQYLQTSQEVAQIAPELIRGYDAQGRAIIATGSAIDQLISKQEELQNSARDTFVSDSSINDLVSGIRVSDAFKDNSKNVFGDNLGYLQKQTGALKKALQSVGIEEFDAATKQLFGREINLINPSTDDLRLISEHYGDIYRLIESKNSDLTDKQKEGLQNAFADLGSGWKNMTDELQPLSEAIGQYLSSEGLDTIGLNLGEEFTGAFNAGLKDLTMTAAMENWDATEIKTAARDYAEGFKEMTQEGSEYANIMDKVTAEQEKYNESIGDAGAIDNYKAAVEDYVIELEKLADRYDDGTVAGEIFANSLRETAGHIRNYATESIVSLGEAINTLSDELTSARGAQERFQEATKSGDYYTAAEGYKGIIDTVLDEKNVAGQGSLTGWAGAEELLGRTFTDSHSWDEIVSQIKRIQDCFADGSDGVLAFNDLLVENQDKLKGLGYAVGDDWHFDLQTEDLAEYAEVLGMSEEALAGLIDKARQWVPFDLGDPAKIRQALEASEYSMQGISSKGDNLLYTSESEFREEAKKQGIRGNDYTKTKTDAESQGIRFLTVENLTAKNGDGLYADKVLENIGLKGADKTLDNAVAALAKMGFDLEDTKQILTADGLKLADGQATAEAVEQSYNEQAYALENPTVAGIANDTGIIASAATAMLASMGILTDEAKKDIEQSTSKDTVNGAIQTLNPEGGFKTAADHDAAVAQVQSQIADYESTINLLKQSGNDALLPQIQQLEAARDSLQQAVDNDMSAWQTKLEGAKSYVEGIGKTVQEQSFLDAHAFDIQEALQSSDPTALVTTLQQLQQEGNLSSQTMLDLGASLSHLEGNETYIQQLNTLMSQYYESVKAARDETYKPFTITSKLEGDDLIDYVSKIDTETINQKEREILVSAELYGDEKVSAFLDEINDNLEGGNETTKTVLIEATAKVANGDTAGANELLQNAFGEDKAQEIETQLEIICDGSVANPSEVQQAIESEIDSLPIETQIEANIRANVTATYTGEPPKPQKQTINYTTLVDDSKLRAAKKSAQEETKMPISVDDKATPKINSIKTTARQSVTFNVSPNFTGTWTKTLTINKEEHKRGRNYSIPAHHSLTFGSAAGGMNMPKPKKSHGSQITALVGEEGFEVGYIPSEARSVIFGANGPEMTSFPKDTVIYPHNQSKEILRRGKNSHINAGSYQGGLDSVSSGGLRSSVKGSTVIINQNKNKNNQNDKDAKKNNQDTKKNNKEATKVIKKAGNVNAWWWNMGKKVEATQRLIDKTFKKIEKLTNTVGTSLASISEEGDFYIKKLNKQISLNTTMMNKAQKQLDVLDKGPSSKKKKSVKAAQNKVNIAQDKLAKAKNDKDKKAEKRAKKELKKAKKNLRKKQNTANYSTISYDVTVQKKDKKGKVTKTKKNKKQRMDLSPYVKLDEETGAYVVDYKKINSKNWDKSKKKAVMEAAEKKAETYQKRKDTAEDNIEKAQEALDELGKNLYETFLSWEIELTRIWNISQKIAESEARRERAESFSELLEVQLGNGVKRILNADGSINQEYLDKITNTFEKGIQEQVNTITLTQESIGIKANELYKSLSTAGEQTTLGNVQKLVENAKFTNDFLADAEKQLNKASTAAQKVVNAKEDKAEAKEDKKEAKKEKKKAKNTKTKKDDKKAQNKINEAQKAINKANDIIDKQSQIAANAQAAAEDYQKQAEFYIEQNNGRTYTDTEILAYEREIKELEDQIKIKNAALEFTKVTSNTDGTVTIDFHTEEFEKARQEGRFTTADAEKIQAYVQKLVDDSKDIQETYKTLTDQLTTLNTTLTELQEAWVGYADDLLSYLEEKQSKDITKLKTLSDSIKDSLSKLLDQVKKTLQERRNQEDNAKTEQDILRKQQRLASLRANTSGGNQVEIAQLEREINEAQTSYGRALEDQLLDRLSNQADEAAEQREKQIKIQEGIRDTVNNAATVNKWMSNPAMFKDSIRQAFFSAQDWENMPLAKQEAIEKSFQTFYAGLLTNQKKQTTIADAIQTTSSMVGFIEDSLGGNVGKDITDDTANTNSLDATVREIAADINSNINKSQNVITETVTNTATETNTHTDEQLGKQDATNAYNSEKLVVINDQKLSKTELNSMLNLGNKAEMTELSIMQDLANTDAFTWTDVIQAFVDLKGKKTAAETLKGYFGNSPSDSRKKGWKKVFGKDYPKYYKTGGLANYTGPAWLDGTPSKPELVLNSTDTKNFMALRDVLSKAIGSTNSITNSYGGNATYEININVDHLNNDYDVDKVAERVKKIIVKDSSYRNVTQVRNFR